MTATRYVVDCCNCTVAEIEVSGEHVTISPPVGEELYRVQAPPPIEDPSLDHEQMRLEYQARDKIHTLIMERVEGHHVSEAIWADHSSWIIRCTACRRQQLEVANLPKLAHVLASGDWSLFDGVVPLGALTTKL